jgi:hypothetical protein
VSVALPLRPAEHDGRLLVQLGTPAGGHEDGASTPLQLVQVPPFGVRQPIVNAQLEKPVELAIVHLSPRLPTRTMSPDGRLSVTQQLGFAHWVVCPPGHVASLNGPPVLLVIEKLKIVFGQSVVLVDVEVLVLVDVLELVLLLVLVELDDDVLVLDDVELDVDEVEDVELLVLLEVEVDEDVLDEDVLDEDELDVLEDDDVDVVDVDDVVVLEVVEWVVLLDVVVGVAVLEVDELVVLLVLVELVVGSALELVIVVVDVDVVVLGGVPGQYPFRIGFFSWNTRTSFRRTVLSGPKSAW